MGRAGREKARSWCRREERGAALVEAVIILPVLLLLTFGAVEFGIGYSQKAGLETLARAGARKAATEQGVDDIVTHTQIGTDTASAVNGALGQASLPELNYLYVYRLFKSGPTTWTSTGPSSFGGACGDATTCLRYKYDPVTKLFVYDNHGTWGATPQASMRNACIAGTEDRVGVTVQGRFAFLTGLVGSGKAELTATSILQLEPTACA